jgi:hypothetical protein
VFVKHFHAALAQHMDEPQAARGVIVRQAAQRTRVEGDGLDPEALEHGAQAI